jgi:uncharacterized protein
VNNSPAIIDSHVALGQEHHLNLSVPELLSNMDQAGVAISIARPLGAEVAVHNRAGNDRCLTAGPRIRALAAATPWLGDEAVAELNRCHDLGAVGLYLHPSRQGFFPTDPIVEPLIQFAATKHWPIVFHTGTYIHSDVLAVAELARRHPHLTFLCDTAGFTDMWFELPGLMTDHPNISLCASLIWTKAIANAIKIVGASRILFGSGAPRDSLQAALKRIARLELPESDRRAILYDNAARVFSLSHVLGGEGRGEGQTPPTNQARSS